MNYNAFIALLDDYRSRFPGRAELVDEMSDLSSHWPQCFSRKHFSPGHFTGSAWVTDPQRRMVLLTHHRRLDRWLQLGGHGENETDIRHIALREALEESGLDRSAVSLADEGIFDIDIHNIPPGKGEPAHKHFDIRFRFFADSSLATSVSEESHDLAWVALDSLESYSKEQSMLRMRDLSLNGVLR